jgi:hypothetical protein
MFTIKHTLTNVHIQGLTTASGHEIHKIPGSADTGASYGTLADAIRATDHADRPLCRTCRVAAELILNRK